MPSFAILKFPVKFEAAPPLKVFIPPPENAMFVPSPNNVPVF